MVSWYNFRKREKIVEVPVPEKEKFSEFKRQSFHIFYGVVIIAAVMFFDKLIVANILTLILFIGGMFSYIHHKSPLWLIDAILKHVERRNSLFPGKGAFFFTFGALMTLYIFPQNIALAGMTVLTFGDSISHLVGLEAKKRRNSNSCTKKAFEGTIAGIIISSIIASFFVDPVFAFFGASIALIVELLENVFAKLDDNFYIPLISSVVIFLLQFFFT